MALSDIRRPPFAPLSNLIFFHEALKFLLFVPMSTEEGQKR
jgi:hypothetical protein